MKYTYIALEITEWVGSYGTRYFCHLFTDEGGKRDSRQISIEEARVLQWELLKRGAVKTTRYNPFGGHIYTRHYRLIDLGWC